MVKKYGENPFVLILLHFLFVTIFSHIRYSTDFIRQAKKYIDEIENLTLYI
jgi:hypothetical protein